MKVSPPVSLIKNEGFTEVSVIRPSPPNTEDQVPRSTGVDVPSERGLESRHLYEGLMYTLPERIFLVTSLPGPRVLQLTLLIVPQSPWRIRVSLGDLYSETPSLSV